MVGENLANMRILSLFRPVCSIEDRGSENPAVTRGGFRRLAYQLGCGTYLARVAMRMGEAEGPQTRGWGGYTHSRVSHAGCACASRAV
jgi:hypothetical protein